MDREERHQLKHDEFIDGTAKVFHYLEHNPKPFLLAVGGVVLVVAGAWGVNAFLASRERRAAELLAQGTAALHAPVVSTEAPRPDDLYRPTFASEAERAKKAAARLATASEAGGDAGAIAAYLRGVALVESGDGAGAVAALEKARNELGDDRTLGTSVKAALAEAYLAAGRFDDSAAAWRTLSTDESYPKELALTGLAQALERAGKKEEAVASYREVVSGFGSSPVASTAKAALARLE